MNLFGNHCEFLELATALLAFCLGNSFALQTP